MMTNTIKHPPSFLFTSVKRMAYLVSVPHLSPISPPLTLTGGRGAGPEPRLLARADLVSDDLVTLGTAVEDGPVEVEVTAHYGGVLHFVGTAAHLRFCGGKVRCVWGLRELQQGDDVIRWLETWEWASGRVRSIRRNKMTA